MAALLVSPAANLNDSERVTSGSATIVGAGAGGGAGASVVAGVVALLISVIFCFDLHENKLMLTTATKKNRRMVLFISKNFILVFKISKCKDENKNKNGQHHPSYF
jgi:hypothetical protein